MSDLVKRLRIGTIYSDDEMTTRHEAADALEAQAARIAELEAALLNLIEHTLDCELELDKLHGLGNGAGAGMSSVLCEAHAVLEGGKNDPAA